MKRLMALMLAASAVVVTIILHPEIGSRCQGGAGVRQTGDGGDDDRF